MTVVVTAVFRAAPGAKDDLVRSLRESIPAVHAEPGCELYAIHDAEDGTITMIEKWSSAEELAAHAAGPAVVALDAAIAPHLAEPVVVTRMEPIDAGNDEQGKL